MKIFVCSSAGAGVFGWLIRKVTKSKVNHVFILYESEFWGGWFAIDIAEKGPIPTPAKKAFKDCSKLYVYEPLFDLREGIVKNKKRINRGYDWIGILGFFFAYVKSWFTKKEVENKLHSSKRDFCSEYLTYCIKDSSGSMAEMLEPESTSPKVLDLMWSDKDELYKPLSLNELLEMGVPITKELCKSWDE